MSRLARFRVVGRIDMASRTGAATVTVDRATGIVEVRLLRRRRTYQMPLADVARWVVDVNVRAEIRERKARKKAARRGR